MPPWGGAPLVGLQPAALGQALQHGLVGRAVVGHALGEPRFFVANGVAVLAALRAVARDLLKCAAGHDHGGRYGVQAPVLGVAHHVLA